MSKPSYHMIRIYRGDTIIGYVMGSFTTYMLWCKKPRKGKQ